jgi:nucleoside-triphosphatase THEP1
MVIIGISGKLGVGKSTIARHIVASLENWQIAAFADLLKQETAKRFDFDVRLTYTPQGKETVISRLMASARACARFSNGTARTWSAPRIRTIGCGPWQSTCV